MADVNKNLLGLLIGIARHDYYHETDITEAVLKQELFPDMSDDEYAGNVLKIKGILKVCLLY